MFKLQIPTWAKLALFILLGLLIISLMRGCSNERAAAATIIDYKNRINKYINDSIDNCANKANYFDTTEYLNGQLDLSNIKILSLTENLDSADKRIATLLKKHVPVEPDPDTSVTLVPNLYIEECSECFTELSNGQQLVKKTLAEKANQERLLNGKISSGSARIAYLEKYSAKLESDYKKELDSAKSVVEQRRILYFKVGAAAINQYFPNSIGPGLVYQDKKKRLFMGSVYASKYNPVFTIDLAFPLSLKKR